MKKIGFFILALVIFGIIIYVTFVIAVIKIVFGAILLAVSAIALIIIWYKIKHRLED